MDIRTRHIRHLYQQGKAGQPITMERNGWLCWLFENEIDSYDK
jgi:hypothetical protein